MVIYKINVLHCPFGNGEQTVNPLYWVNDTGVQRHWGEYASIAYRAPVQVQVHQGQA